ncbi:DUF6266 family protein [Pedobacter metabolipauper]|uniref:DUF6266 family protein n=1 Tax=Pedobacter metabolipauper TaxID=425513 RepID=UPI001060F94E|nr:DUF6266 family protein [Pedobacter metabolipauper]
MGIQSSGPFGGFYNKTGPLVGRRGKGKYIITGLHHASNKPPSGAQLITSFKLGLLMKFLSHFNELINKGFKNYSKGKTKLNAACRYNYERAFITNEQRQKEIDYKNIVYSRGRV